MRVLHVSLRITGGTAAAIRQYAEAIPEFTHTLAAPGGRTSEQSADGVFAERINLDGGLISARSQLRVLLLSGRFDLVHAHSSHAGALLRFMPVTVPVVYTPHGLATLAPPLSRAWLLGQSERLLGHRRIVMAPVSADEAMRLQLLSPASTVVQICNRPMLDIAAGSRFSRELRVVGSGRLAVQKDPGFFAALARLCRAREPSITFTWVGAGSRRYERLLADSGVSTTGWLGRDGLRATLSTHTVYVHSARYEGASIGLLDAAAVGLPVIGRPVPGLLELSWVRHCTSPEEAVAAIRDLSQPESWAQQSDRSLQGVRTFDRATQRAGLLDAYDAALRPGPEPAIVGEATPVPGEAASTRSGI